MSNSWLPSVLTARPSSVSTSTVPVREEMARLPCLATFTPAPAATRAAAVEMLRVCRPSPPVLIFSARDYDNDLASQVTAFLVKSRTTNQELKDAILNLILGMTRHTEKSDG